MTWLKRANNKTPEEVLLDVYTQLPAEQQNSIRNILSIYKRIYIFNYKPSTEDAELNINLGNNALTQINNLLSSLSSNDIKQELTFGLSDIYNNINQAISYYNNFINQETLPEIPEEIIEDDIEVIEEPAKEWHMPKEDKPQKKRALTSKFLSEEVKSEREKEIEAQELGLTKEQYDKVNEPIEEAVKITANIEFPDPDELDIEDFESAHIVLEDRKKEVPESLQEQYGILTDAVGIIANTDEQNPESQMRAEIAFREFEAVFAELANALSKEAPELFDDLSEWLGVIYVAAYKIASEFNMPQSQDTAGLTIQQSGGSQAAYDFRKNIKDYWKKYRQGGVFKRIYHPETKSFTTEYVGNDPKKREKVLYNTRKNFDNYILRLKDSGGKKDYYAQKAEKERQRYKTKTSKDEIRRLLKTLTQKNKYYINKIKAASAMAEPQKQQMLTKIEEKRQQDLVDIKTRIKTLSLDEQKEIAPKIKEMLDKTSQKSKQLLSIAYTQSYKLYSLASFFSRSLG